MVDIMEVKFLKKYQERGGESRGKVWYITYLPGQSMFMKATLGQQLVSDGTCTLVRSISEVLTFRGSDTPIEVKRPARKTKSKKTIKK